MDDNEIVVVCGSGDRFHEAYKARVGTWRAVCGTGVGTESWMPAWQALLSGWTPCKRCFGEEPE